MMLSNLSGLPRHFAREALLEVEKIPVVQFVQQVLSDAIQNGVSDIHFEPYEKDYRIRFRKDGLLYTASNPPLHLMPEITARIKILAQLDISERRLSQDGHFHMPISKIHSIHFRVSTCPTITGEKVVIRILDSVKLQVNIEDLGYEPFQQKMFIEAIHQPQGMILVTGPTGSGKTISLYSALHILNKPHHNISTIEDPVEINIPGINQVNINPKVGFSFAAALRAFLRQDPDIIMVGEIRCPETAEIAMKAAETGHLVLSTLHTNSALETLSRLIHMGLSAIHIATSLNLIVAQRLARCLCQHCKIPETFNMSTLLQIGFLAQEINNVSFYTSSLTGCAHCKGGYNGRIGIFEVLPVTPVISDIILQGGHIKDIEKQAIQEGFQSLRRSGLNKVLSGVTSLAEINRIIAGAGYQTK